MKTCPLSIIVLPPNTHCEKSLRDSMLNPRRLTALALSVLASLHRVRGASSIPGSNYSSDAAGAILAQDLALTDVTFSNGSSNSLGVAPSDPLTWTTPGPAGGEFQFVMKDWSRPWIPKSTLRSILDKALIRFPLEVSLC